MATEFPPSATMESLATLFQAVLNETTDSVFVKDWEGRYVLVNQAVSRLTGLASAAMLGRTDHELFAPGEADLLAAADRNVLDAGVSSTLEERLTSDGAERIYSTTKAPWRSERGEILGLVGIARDITARTRTEAHTAAQNRVLEQIAQGVEVPQILRQINHFVESCLPYSACTCLLLDAEGKGSRWIDAERFPPDFLDAHESALPGEPLFLSDLSADPRAEGYRQALLHRGFRAAWLLPVLSSPERGFAAEPSPLGTLAVALAQTGEPTPTERDALRQATHLAGIAISRERALRRLSESQRFIQGLADASPSVLYLFDLPTRSLGYVSRQVAAELGYSAEEISAIGLGGYLTLLHPDDQAQMPQRFARWNQARDGEAIETEYRLRAKDGGWRWFLSRDTVFSRAANGAVLQLVGVTQNITARKQLEEQLRQAQKREALGRLAGGVAHDFNNLLTVVRSATELMLAQTDAAHPFRGDLELILRAAERGASLTQRLLAFGRRQEWSLAPLDVNHTLRELLPLLQRAVGGGVRLTYHLEDALPPIRGAAEGLEQALLNLALNARDAMPDGGSLGITTRLVQPDSTTPETASPPAVWIELQDTGVGIDPAALRHIFDPFFTTKPVGQGAGLGLAVVEGIVSEFGGTLAVESQPGAGARFRLAFPALPTARY